MYSIVRDSPSRIGDRMSSRGSFDRFGQAYNVSMILTDNATLDVAKYEAYSPLFLSTVFAVSYGLSFASITATITHTFLYYRKQIWTQARRSINEQADIHARLMARYPQVPEWWYATIFGERLGMLRPRVTTDRRILHPSHDVRIRYRVH